VLATKKHTSSAESEIRSLIDGWAEAIRAKDINARMSNYAPEVVLFDVVDPLQYIGPQAVRRRALEWFSSFDGPLDFEHRDVSIAAGDSVAFCHSLNRIRGTKTDGRAIDMWWRASVCLRRIAGQWMVTHEHQSVPFNVDTGRASIDLKP
jgi:ketosteroid isomerase-like protein